MLGPRDIGAACLRAPAGVQMILEDSVPRLALAADAAVVHHESRRDALMSEKPRKHLEVLHINPTLVSITLVSLLSLVGRIPMVAELT